MSPLPIFQPLFGDNSDIAILSDGVQHLLPDRRNQTRRAVSSEYSAWVASPLRRCFDSVFAGAALIAAAPVMCFIALFVYRSSPGPVLFRQKRAGRYREEFTLYKFRSMRPSSPPGPAFTVHGDPRVTPIGAFLRHYKLDELPQLFNVLKGDLSLVGPRPKLPHHEALDLPYRPGLTGVATLAFRDEEQILAEIGNCHADRFYETCIKPHKACLDREYMRKATLWTDLALLWRTMGSCLLPSKRYLNNESDKLKLMASNWPADPTQSAELDGACTANYYARVDLLDTESPSAYQMLDQELERQGFSRLNHAHNSYRRLAAFYFSESQSDDFCVVARAVKQCANHTGYSNSVLVIKSARPRPWQ